MALSNYNLSKYADSLYGTEVNAVHHYETKEVKDSSGKLILPKGKTVPGTFKIHYYDAGQLHTNDATILGENVVRIPNPVVSVTNFEYEVLKNDKKSSIYLLRPSYLQQFLNDMRDIMIYGRSSEYVGEKLIRTDNTKLTMP